MRAPTGQPDAPTKSRVLRQAGRLTRLIRPLRAHKLLVKVPNVHRYHVPPKARRLLTALQAARQADVEKLTQLAA